MFFLVAQPRFELKSLAYETNVLTPTPPRNLKVVPLKGIKPLSSR